MLTFQHMNPLTLLSLYYPLRYPTGPFSVLIPFEPEIKYTTCTYIYLCYRKIIQLYQLGYLQLFYSFIQTDIASFFRCCCPYVLFHDMVLVKSSQSPSYSLLVACHGWFACASMSFWTETWTGQIIGKVVEIIRSFRRDSISNGRDTFKHVCMTHKIKGNWE